MTSPAHTSTTSAYPKLINLDLCLTKLNENNVPFTKKQYACPNGVVWTRDH